MKNKLLSYLLGWILAVLPCFIAGNVQADCDCPQEDINCRKECQYESEEYEKSNTPDNTTEKKCNGIKLNTNFPIIWNCISTGGGTDARNAFPTMIWALTKIAMALIFIICFIMIIVAWIMWAWAGEDASQAKKAKDWIFRVAVTVLLLWFSWVILRLINPNFFG